MRPFLWMDLPLKRIVGTLLLCFLLAGCSGARSASPGDSTVKGLTMEEYPLKSDSESIPSALDMAEQVKVIREKREPWRTPSPERWAAIANPILAPGGYKLVPRDKGMDLYRGDQLAESGLGWLNDVFPARGGKDFWLWSGGAHTADGPVTPLPPEVDNMFRPPILTDAGLTHLYWDQPTQSIQVIEGGKVVYSYYFPKNLASPSQAATGFTVWDGQWVLETWEDEVIVGGENLNKKLGYEAVFGVQRLNQKPFYFYKKGGKVRISYDGQTLPHTYDSVFHKGCCDSTGYNPRGNPFMVSFYAKRNGQWLYVDAGIYE